MLCQKREKWSKIEKSLIIVTAIEKSLIIVTAINNWKEKSLIIVTAIEKSLIIVTAQLMGSLHTMHKRQSVIT